MHLDIDPSVRSPVYLQIIDQIRRRIAAGELRPGDRLPAVRDLAVLLVINPNTVQKAYSELMGAGLVHSRKGQGVYVSEVRPTLSDEERRRRAAELADGYITESLLLGFSRAQTREILAERLKEFDRKEVRDGK